MAVATVATVAIAVVVACVGASELRLTRGPQSHLGSVPHPLLGSHRTTKDPPQGRAHDQRHESHADDGGSDVEDGGS